MKPSANLLANRMRADLFTPKEREYIWEGLREIWNNTPVRNTRIRDAIDKLMDEFDDNPE